MVMLEVERKFIEERRNELLQQYGGKFLVIKGEEVTGAYDTMDEALQGAASKHGLESVLIRRPVDVDQEVSVPALMLGILSANLPDSDKRTG